jgi:hypothetical protein
MRGPASPRALVLVLFGCSPLPACRDPSTAETAKTAEDGDSSEGTDEPPRPNWHGDIAPIVHARCVGCHHSGGVAPFDLSSYEAAAPWAEQLAEAVAARTMPPWGAHETEACQPAHGWVDDLRPSAAEIDAIAEWAALGAPEGDPTTAAPLPSPPDGSLADPSDILEAPAPVAVEGTFDSYACVSLDPGLDELVWITGVELLPDAAEIVHHALLMLDETGASAELAGPDGSYPCEELHLGTMLGSYFPGSAATELPDQVGVPFPVGARIVVGYHYHPTGAEPTSDHSRLAVRWTSEPPAYEALISTLGNATSAAEGLLPGPADPEGVPTFMIPAGAGDHSEIMEITIPEWLPTVELFMLGPHMHHVGADFRVTLERAGETRCLLHDPHWDFDWQRTYTIDAQLGSFPTLEAGDVLRLRCGYDNSLANPELVETLAEFGLDAPINVYFGSAGLDEMCMLVYGIAAPR